MRLNKKKYMYKMPNDITSIDRVILKKGKFMYTMHIMSFIPSPGKRDIATPNKCAFMGGYLYFDTYPPKAWSIEVMAQKRVML